MKPSTRELLICFTLIGISGFGGVLPWARRYIVERNHWLDAAEFNAALGLCQLLPGPNIVNLAIHLGTRYQGWRGALAASAGILGPPLLIMLCLGLLWQHYGGLPIVARTLHAVAAVAAGLILATSGKMLMPYRKQPMALALVIAIVVLIVILRQPMLPSILGLALLGIMYAAWQKRRRDARAP